ncbi:MAG: hypothetical protein V1870_05355 [Candidatus Aenigmatarchaeota archaeon]
METIARPKKWGNSIGIIIPKIVLEQEEITLEDELIVHIEKKDNVSKKRLMKEGYVEMKNDIENINKEWEVADFEE